MTDKNKEKDITPEIIREKIYIIRGKKVMLDRDAVFKVAICDLGVR